MINKKKIIGIIAISLAVFLLLSGFLSVYFCYLHRYKGNEIINPFERTDEFDINNIVCVEKQVGKPFVILNLADIQLCDIEDFFHRKTIKKEIDYLIKNVKPDLITLTGDQTWSNENLMSLRLIISTLDSYKIPYAPVFGNHDYGNDYNSSVASLNYCCDLYESGKYCLFNRGPSNLGSLGNYVINITENNKIVKTLYMLDAGYNYEISDKQIDWVKWNAEGIKKEIGCYSEGMCFMHKPLPEYRTAYYEYLSGNAKSVNDVYVNCSLFGTYQNGFFDFAKEINVLDIVCGHQHTNNFTIEYDGIRLTFALKTGELSFYYNDGNINLNGGTYFTLDKGETKIDNFYVPCDMFHIEGSENSYCG